jgi:hypothetical protein
MANKTVLIPLSTQAYDLRTRTENFIAAADVENGQLLAMDSLSTDADKTEVYTYTTPATATFLGLYMAYAPEDLIVTLADGTQYKVDNMNPQNFVNVSGRVFAAFKPQVDDKILITAEGFTGAKGGSDTHANAADGQSKLVWGTAAGNGLSFKLEKVSYISIAKGSIGSQRVTAYQMRCVKN